jgi:16S rRNA (guanine966-N2)-methyltransferase
LIKGIPESLSVRMLSYHLLRHETEPKSLSNNRKKLAPKSHKQSNQLRIIGGQWRGRKLSFPTAQGLRPTADRVRETLFNWLSPSISGAHCLDLFAGSGALGLEALSRGASFCCFIDTAAAASQHIAASLALLQCDNATTHTAQAAPWLEQLGPGPNETFDIIFLDPPFGKNLAEKCLALIDQKQLVRNDGLVYLETNRDEALPATPPHWQLHREKTAGQVGYRLYRITRL